VTSYATSTGLAARWRPLTDEEAAAADVLLADASTIVRSTVPGVDERIADGSLSAELVAGVVIRAVLRVLRNPEGKVQESVDDYSYRRADAVSDGSLYISASDLALLTTTPGVARGAFTIRPGR
jgi:hypothetical protein